MLLNPVKLNGLIKAISGAFYVDDNGFSIANLAEQMANPDMLALAFEASGLAASRAPRGLAEQGIGVALLAWLFALPFLVRRRAVALP